MEQEKVAQHGCRGLDVTVHRDALRVRLRRMTDDELVAFWARDAATGLPADLRRERQPEHVCLFGSARRGPR